MAEENKKDAEPVETVSIKYKYNRNVTTVYANNVLLQRNEHEFVLSFFESLPFVESPDGEAYRKKASKEGIDAECVARIVFSTSFLPKLADVLNRNLPQPSKEQMAELLKELQSEIESK